LFWFYCCCFSSFGGGLFYVEERKVVGGFLLDFGVEIEGEEEYNNEATGTGPFV